MLLTLNDGAIFLGVTAACLRRWERRGLLSLIRSDGRVFVDQQELCDRPLLTIGRAAKVVGRSWRTAKRWKDAGLIEPYYENQYISPRVSKGRVSVNEIIAAYKEWQQRDRRRRAEQAGKGI